MELNLVSVLNKETNKVTYHAVNDRHYDGMLAAGGSEFEDKHPWDWLGDVEISEEILNEQGYFYKEKDE